MQNFDSANIQMDHLLFELTRCVNDLQGFYRQLSIEDRKQIELSLSKLEFLVSHSDRYQGQTALAVV
ncbi:hypothetical protein [Legionella israelensis]|uniref:Uncharacterized protein n=1 Tax=Legionella israelensis TaxID=454 RepID=A0A0W0W4X8_9GAMM|nr:hypothetical protein [Legionella israelensis]KTD27476.1 hypothetical protein Lisr_0993 [Legionella israelensis]QBS10526.1 hypothetical protein E4T55_12130 [Legionella israelensis]SCY44566.1 hypothetical protein SAMN02746069_02475 [Legionella israelensis DSM 19235]STX57461.1 Uncharacterised protein [Legionella israelensis]